MESLKGTWEVSLGFRSWQVKKWTKKPVQLQTIAKKKNENCILRKSNYILSNKINNRTIF